MIEKIITPKLEALDITFERYGIDTPLRKAHFLAQVLHESGGFKYMEEIWGNTAAQQRYDTRVDLGNTPDKDGDGYKYRGRGAIQLTGKANYKAASKEFNMDFVANPDLVSKDPWNILIAGWFWNKKNLNVLADKDDITTITRRINGGLNGLTDRVKWFVKTKAYYEKG